MGCSSRRYYINNGDGLLLLYSNSSMNKRGECIASPHYFSSFLFLSNNKYVIARA
jgi:hypothetical protein